MAAFMHEKAFGRKSFIKGTGAVVAGLALADRANAAVGATGNTPFGQRNPNDFLTLGDPRLTQIDTWLSITPSNTVIVTHGEAEFSGAPTGILMLIAEELNITDMSMMVYAHPESWLNSIGGGGGSGAISTRSTVARAAAAQALKLMLQAASTKLGVPVGSLSASNGVISGGGQKIKYSDLYGGQNFNFDLATLTPAVTTTTGYIPGQGNTKPVSQYQLVGRLVHRIDIPAKIAGTYTYIQNIRIPGMVHARRVRPRGAGANASQNHYPLSIDPKSVSHIPGVQVVQIGNFLAVVAPKEYDAIQAAAQLKVVWKDDPKFSVDSGNYWSWLRKAGDTNQTNPARWVADTGAVPAALAGAAKTVSATYQYQYNTYVPIGPHCAVADVRVGNPSDPTKNSATIYFCAQGTNPATGMGAGGGSTTPISTILAALPNPILIPQNQIRLLWYEGSGSYGAGQSPQASEEAAVISATIGKPVRMQWMRWDQTGWDSWGASADVRRHDWRELDGIDRRFRLDVVRTVRQHSRHRSGAPRTVDLAGDAAEWRPDAVGRWLDRNPVREHELRLRLPVPAAGAGEDAAVLQRCVEEHSASCAERAAVVLRERADRRRARACNGHRSVHVPEEEHGRDDDDRGALARSARRGGASSRI